MGTIKLLESNLVEIAYSQQYKKKLIADPWDHLYQKNSFLGRLWTFLYNFAEAIAPDQYRQKALLKALQKTNLLFKKNLKKALDAAASYKNYLAMAAKGSVNESQYCKARKILLLWTEATELTRKISRSNPGPLNTTFAVEAAAAQTIKNCQAFIDLEGLMGEPLPLPLFSKIALEKELGTSEKKKLACFIRKINSLCYKEEREDFELVAPLHRALGALILHLFLQVKEKSWPYRLLLGRLEATLQEKGCKVFYQKERAIRAKYLSLKKGDETKPRSKLHNIPEITEEETRLKGENFAVFNLKKENEKVLIFGYNRAIIGIEAHYSNKKYCSTSPRQIFELKNSPSCCALAERFKRPFFTNWKDKNSDIVIETKSLKPLVDLVTFWLKEKIFIPGLHPSSLVVDIKNHLRCTGRVNEKAFDFNKVETFIRKCAKKNSLIFVTVMRESGMVEHNVAKFYEKTLREKLSRGPLGCRSIAVAERITCKITIERAKKMRAEAFKWWSKAETRYFPDHFGSSRAAVEKYLTDLLIYLYKQAGGGSELSKPLKKRYFSTIQTKSRSSQ